MTDEEFYLMELNHYTKCLFDTRKKLFTKEIEDEEYLKSFAEYCKEQVYYYAEKLTELKGVEK